MSMNPDRLTLAKLEEGERFRLARTGRRYLLKKKEGRRYFVKPIGHVSGLVCCDGSFHGSPASLHYNSYVERI